MSNRPGLRLWPAGEFYCLTREFVAGVQLRQALTAGRLKPQQASLYRPGQKHARLSATPQGRNPV